MLRVEGLICYPHALSYKFTNSCKHFNLKKNKQVFEISTKKKKDAHKTVYPIQELNIYDFV